MNIENRIPKCFIIAALFMVAVNSATHAADYTWDASGGAPLNDGGGTWASSGGANWFNGSVYGAWGNTTADKAIIGVGNGAAGTIWQVGTNVLNKLTFNAAGSGSYTLNQNGVAGANVLSFGGTAPAIEVNSSALIDQSQWDADDNIAFDGDTLTVNIASGQTLTTRRMKGANANSTVFVTGGGTLRLLWDYYNNKFLNYSIASGSVLHLEGDRDTPLGTNTVSGGGTLRISGGMIQDGNGVGLINLSLASGGMIDIQSGGELRNGGWNNINFATNLGDLNVDGKFDVWDGKTVYVDALTGSGTITKAQQWNNVTLVVGIDNGSGTFSGSITTNAAAQSTVMHLVKTGSGTQTLSGLCEYAGATTVNNGVLQLAAGATLNPATVVSIDYPGKLNLDINPTVKQLMLDGVPKAAGTWGSTSSSADNKSDMYFQGTGVLTVMTGPKAYAWDADGVAPLNDGGGNWASSGGLNWFNGSTYGAWGNTVTDVAVIGAGNGGASTITQSGTVTLNGLVFDAPGSGNYTIDQSAVTGVNTLSFGGTGPAIVVNTSATIAQAEGGDDRMELASGNLTINIANGQTLTMRKLSIANKNSSVIVTGGGTLDVLYEAYNKFMEGIDGSGSATLFVKGNSRVRLAQAFHCISDNVRVDVAAGSTLDLNGKSEGLGYLSGAGSVSNLNSGAASLTLDLPSYSSGALFSGTINGPGELYVRGLAGVGIQVLSGASTYAGGTRITRGTLKLGAAGVIPDGSGKGDLSFDPVSPNTATFDLAGNSETINGLSSSGTGSSVVDNTLSGAATLTVGNDNDTTTFGGTIKNAAGTLALAKVGTGTLVLSGNNNTYSGVTTISGGTLCVSNTTGSATGSGSVLIASAGTLSGNGTVSGIVTNSGTLSPGSLIGTLTTGGQVWNTGCKLICEMNDATGAAGTGYDTMTVNGVLNLSAATTCTVKLVTLNGAIPGQPANFTAGRSYTWTLAVASGGITGFSSDRFVVDKSAVVGPHEVYRVETNGNTLLLKYSSVGTLILCF